MKKKFLALSLAIVMAGAAKADTSGPYIVTVQGFGTGSSAANSQSGAQLQLQLACRGSYGGSLIGVPHYITSGGGTSWSTSATQQCQYYATAPSPKSVPGDLFFINPTSGASGKTEIHVLSAASGYKTYILHAASALSIVNPDQYSFALGDANGDGNTDVYVIKRYGTGSGMLEVHILDGATGYSTFLGHYATSAAMATNPLDVTFDVADFNGDGVPDLYRFVKNNTSTGHTELHVYDGASNFQKRLIDAALPVSLVPNSDAWEFRVANLGKSGKPDVYAISKNSNTTEVHVISAASNYTATSADYATPLGRTGVDLGYNFDLNDVEKDGKTDAYIIKRLGATGLEVHALKGDTFQSYDLHSSTALGVQPADDSRVFLIRK